MKMKPKGIARTIAELAFIEVGLDKTKVLDVDMGGSTAINGSGDDIDVLVYCPTLKPEDYALFAENGWSYQLGAEYEIEDNCSFESFKRWDAERQATINLLLINDYKLFILWQAATQMCIALKEYPNFDMQRKELRIGVHRVIMGEDSKVEHKPVTISRGDFTTGYMTINVAKGLV